MKKVSKTLAFSGVLMFLSYAFAGYSNYSGTSRADRCWEARRNAISYASAQCTQAGGSPFNVYTSIIRSSENSLERGAGSCTVYASVTCKFDY